MEQQYQASPKPDNTYQPSAPSEVPALQTPPSLREKYTFIREIGHGTQGRIYLAEQNSDHSKVAIKQLNIESVKNWKAYDLFQREAQTLASLNIDGVAKFHEAIECLEDTPPCSYIVQEYIHAQSLSDMLKAGHRFTLNRVYDIIMQLLDILKQLHVHEPPVIHRDIKPSNILLKALGGDDYEVYLIDFGAVANPQVQGGGSTVAGTFGYMAPEQLTGKPCPASDIYSLGAVAVYLISGRSPADMPIKDFHLIFEPDMQNMPVALVNTLRSMLEPDLQNRLSDIDTLTERFLNFYRSIYHTQDFQTEAFSEIQLLDQLRKVQNYGEDGNLDIWQSLPDKTPRDLPFILRSMQTDVCFQIHPPEHENFCFDETAKARMRQLALEGQGLDMWESTSFVKVIPKVYLGAVAFTPFILPGVPLSKAPLIIVAFFLVITFFLGFFIVIVLIIHMFTLMQRKASMNLQSIGAKEKLSVQPSYVMYYKNDLNIDHRAQILKNGRKTIATICSIKYLPVHTNNVENVYLQKINKIFNGQVLSTHACHGKPCFEIRYKFNPPDDKREEDIVHSIIVHEDPTQYLKEGDPLPILYCIEPTVSDRYSKPNHILYSQQVISIPFPYPLSDPTNILEIQACDKCYWEEVNYRQTNREEIMEMLS